MSITSSPASTRNSAPIAPGDGVQRDQYIERQLTRTSLHVKLVDLCSALGVLAAGTLSFLLIAAIIDHWIFPLGTVGRWLALLTLLAGTAYYVATVIGPLIFRRINPVYSARAIEHAEPSLKNSLINFLLFKSDRAGVRVGIYRALEQRAATDLSHVNAESAVDRSRLIKIGYVLVVVLVLCAAYTILAPKSPFQTMARVLAPWADIAQPSRVRIEDVRPGDAEVFQGQSLAISARCFDLQDDEPVTLCYSSLDGQLSRQTLAMQLDESGLRHECELSDDEGLQRDLVYWIQAGDATTPSYRVRVVPAPSILVERIEYDYPAYTQMPKKVVEHRGDIQAIEGTRVTLRARANQAIAAAVVEFDPASSVDDGGADDRSGLAKPQSLAASAHRVEMEVKGQEAWCSFYLDLDDARLHSRHQSYHVRFLSEDGHGNPHPVLHRMHVLRDLPPEIEILTPETDRTEVPEDGQQKIEIRAIDPDFGIREIRLRAVAGNQEIVNALLLEDADGQTGQSIVSYDFQPGTLGLSDGDSVTYWAIVQDNRYSPESNSAAPNLAKTRDYTFIITPPADPKATDPQEPEDPSADSDPSSPDSGTPNDPSDGQDASATSDDSAAGDSGDQEEPGSEGTEDGPPQSGGSGSEESGTSPDSAAGEQTGGGSGTDGTGQDSDGQSESTDSSGGSSSDSPSDGSTGDSASQDGSGGGSAGGSPSSSSSDGGATPDPSDMVPGGEGGREEPLHDGEAFEKALEHMSKSGEGGSSAESQSPASTDAQGSEASSDASGSPSESNPDSAQPQSPGQDGGTPGKKPGDQPPADSAEQESTSDGAGSPADKPSPGGGQRPNESQEGQPQPGGESGEQPRPKQPPAGGGSPQGSSGGEGKKQQGSAEGGGDGTSGQSEGKKSSSGEGGKQESGSGSKPKQDRKKQGGSGSSKPQSADQSQTPDQSRQKSGGQGEESSDRSGSGKAGSGQGSNQPGSDGPGGSSPSDAGAGAAEESGSGELSSDAGDTQQSDTPTGKPGEYEGAGTDARPGGGSDGGTGPQGDSDQNSQTRPAEPSTSDGRQKAGGQGVPYGGGAPSDGDLKGFDVTGEVPPGEKPNVDYARKATELVLDYLKDQQQSPDQELLDELGWSKEDMQGFVERWQSMKQSAVENPAKQTELDDALRSLGLRPTGGDPRQSATKDDTQRAVRNIGTHSNPPPGYADQFDAYRKGTARIIRD